VVFDRGESQLLDANFVFEDLNNLFIRRIASALHFLLFKLLGKHVILDLRHDVSLPVLTLQSIQLYLEIGDLRFELALQVSHEVHKLANVTADLIFKLGGLLTLLQLLWVLNLADLNHVSWHALSRQLCNECLAPVCETLHCVNVSDSHLYSGEKLGHLLFDLFHAYFKRTHSSF
jgi:hypothetical protein